MNLQGRLIPVYIDISQNLQHNDEQQSEASQLFCRVRDLNFALFFAVCLIFEGGGRRIHHNNLLQHYFFASLTKAINSLRSCEPVSFVIVRK